METPVQFSKDPEVRQRRRAGGLIGGAMMLMIVTTQVFAARAPIEVGHVRLIEIVRTSAFVLLVVVLALRSTTAFSLIGKDPTLDDELAQANRAAAARWGYWALILGGLAALVASFFVPLTALDVIPYMLMLGAFVPAMRFARAERRALKDG